MSLADLLGQSLASPEAQRVVSRSQKLAAHIYPETIFLNLPDLGLSLALAAQEGYKPARNTAASELLGGKVMISTMKARDAKGYKPFRDYPINIKDPVSGAVLLAITDKTSGRDLVAALGEPPRKGVLFTILWRPLSICAGGESIGLWLEWQHLGLHVDIGGKGRGAWDAAGEQVWQSLSLFKPVEAAEITR